MIHMEASEASPAAEDNQVSAESCHALAKNIITDVIVCVICQIVIDTIFDQYWVNTADLFLMH